MSDYNSRQQRRNIVVGLFVLIALGAFIWLLAKFRELPLFASQANSFYIKVNFPEAPGIQPETAVNYCGYQIGRVVDVAPPHEVKGESIKARHVVGVTIAIDKKFSTIPQNIDILIVKRGLGSSFIELRDDPDKPLVPKDKDNPASVYLSDGMVCAGSTGMSSEFLPPEVQKKMEELLASITTLAQNANQIIGDADNKTNIKKTLAHITASTEQAQQTLKSIQTLSDTGSEKIVQVAADLDMALTQLQQVLAKINEGQGTAGQLVNDSRLYENLLDSSQELEMALEQVKRWAADAREKGIRIKW